MPLVKLPINKESTKFAYVDPDSVSMVTDARFEDKECYVSVRGAYATAECDGSVNVYLPTIEVVRLLGKSIVDKVSW